MTKTVSLALALLSTLMASGAAAREPAQELAACVSDANNGQALRQSGRMVDARASFERCARAVCPAVVRNECAAWTRDVAREIGALDIQVVDERGLSVNAEVTVDAARVDVRTVEIDPGPHIVRARSGNAQVESSVIIARGERRKVELVLMQSKPAPTAAAAAPSSSPNSSLRFSAPVLAGFGLGAASLAGGAVFGVLARDRVDDLARDCAPRCTVEDVRGAKTTAFVADVFFVTGAAALVVSGLMFVLDNQSRRDAQLGHTQKPASYGAH